MPVDARVRLESVSKIYTATLILGLAQAGKLRLTDRVDHWLPGLLPYGKRITVGELLAMRSGLVDSNDLANRGSYYLSYVKDAALRKHLISLARRVQADPAIVISPLWWIKWAAWVPLQSAPGTVFHYSNIGYDILGLIAARASRQPLAALYRNLIFQPLGLNATAYDPQGRIAGPHAHGYGITAGSKQVDTTNWHYGIGAGGGIVSNTKDTATFLIALMRGKLLDPHWLAAMKGRALWFGGQPSGCGGQAYGWSGGGDGFKTDVWVSDQGKRVAVLLLNARNLTATQTTTDQAAHDAMANLYCHA